MFRKFALALSLSALFFTLTACGDDGNICKKGQACACTGQSACTWTCEGGGCAFTASNQGAATFDCNSGGCSLTNSSQGDVTLLCSAGGCSVTSTAQGKTDVACAGGGCAVQCNGMGNCNVTECPTCTCNEGSISATCNVQ